MKHKDMGKAWKKIAAVALTAAMVFGTASAVFATSWNDDSSRPANVVDSQDGTTDKETGEFDVTVVKNSTDTATHTYEAYQLFKGDLLIKTESGSTSRKLSNIEWGAGIDTGKLDTLKTELAKVNASFNTITFANTADSATAVAEAISKLNATADSAAAQGIAEAFGKVLGTATKVGSAGADKIEDLKAGYYLIKDKENPTGDYGAQTRYILEVLSDVTVYEKASVPTVEKKVKENTTNTINENGKDTDTRISDYEITDKFNDVADYSIGDVIPFEIIGTVPSTYDDYDGYAYKFHDTMDTGLEYFEDATNKPKVQYRNPIEDGYTGWTEIPAAQNHYTLTGSGQSLEVVFAVTKVQDTYTDKGLKDIADIKAGAQIRVTYYGKLNKNAEIGLVGNKNEVYLEFSNNPNEGGEGSTGTTPKDKVIVFTYELDSTKYADEKQTGNELEGAKFVVKNADGKCLKYDATNKTVEWIDEPTHTANINTDAYVAEFGSDITVFTSTAAGVITKIEGLDEGTYKLCEIQSPKGYNLAKDVTVVVEATTANGQAWDEEPASALTKFEYTIKQEGTTDVKTEGSVDDAIASADIIDKSGVELPSTGGIGTTMFYVIGAILVIGAGVVLVTRKRMAA